MALLKKFYYIFILTIFLLPRFTWSNNLLLFNANNNNFPTLETSVAYFTNNYEPIELKIANSILKINGKETKIDSSILLNSSVRTGAELVIAMELSSAINQSDIELFKSIFAHYSSISKSIFKNIHFVLFAERPIYLSDNSSLYRFLDSIEYFKFNHRADLNKLITSQFFQSIQQSSNSAMLLVTKSLVKINIDQFANLINSKQTKFLHLNLSNYNFPNYEEIIKKTNSISIKKNDFTELDKLLKLSTYLLTSAPYQRFYSSDKLKIGENVLELSSNNDQDSYSLYFSEVDFPSLDITETVYFFGILDTGTRRTKFLRIKGKNRPQVITKITSDNSNYKILNFQPNTKLNPNEEMDIRVEFTSMSTSFDSAVISIHTNYDKLYQVHLYAGKPKVFTKNDLQFVELSEGSKVLGSEILKLKWVGSHPLDTFLVQYKLKDELSWRLISNKNSSNSLNWVVPDLPDTNIQIRLSQLNNKLISDKVLLLEEHKGKITEVSFSPNDSLVATAGEDGFIFLWNAQTGKKVKTLFQSQSKVISGIDWSKDGKYLAIAALDTSIKIWSIESDVLFRELTTTNKVVNIGFSYDGKYLIIRQNDNKILVFQFPSLALVGSYQIPFNLTFFELNPNNHYFLATSIDGNFLVYDYIQQSKVLQVTDVGFPLLSGSFSPSGNNVVVAGMDNKIKIYDLFSGQNVLTLFDSNSPVISVNWLKNRQYIATASGELIKLWSPSDGKLVEIYDQHTSGVYYIKSNNKGSYVASVDQNNIIHLWSPFDFPFIKPLATSIESPNINVVQKKIQTNSYTVSNIQISDTLMLYFEDLGVNRTKSNISIDTLTIVSSSSIIGIDERYSNYNVIQGGSIPVSVNYVPRNIGSNQFVFNIKSGTRVFSSQLNTNVLPNILDKKFLEINFGKVEIGKTKDTSVFILQNISESPIKIDSIKFFNGDDFQLINLSFPFIIRPTGGAFAPTLRFSPTRIGLQGSFFRIYLDKLLPIDVYYYGEGLAPKLEFLNDIKTISNICKLKEFIPIIIKNTGNASLEIKQIDFEGIIKSEFKVFNNPRKIEPGSTDTILIEWMPSLIGKNSTLIIIKTNLQSTNTNESILTFDTENNFYNFNINPNPLIFEPIDDKTPTQKIISIENNGSINSKIKYEIKSSSFKFDSLVNNNDNYFLYITFIGGLNKDYYSDTLLVFDECGQVYKVELLALIRKERALLTIQDSIDFGTLICEQKVEKNILLQNLGNNDLIISKIQLEKPSSNLIINPMELTIPPNSFSYITITFNPTSRQIIDNKLIFNTNAINHPDGIAKVGLIGIKEEVSYTFDKDTIDFGNVVQGEEIEKEVIFTNLGTIPLPKLFENYSNIFTVNYVEEANIFPNQSKSIKIKNNNNNYQGLFIDSLTYRDICGKSKKVILKINFIEITKAINFSLPYPNPTFYNFTLTISANYSYNLSYQLFDYLGKVVNENHSSLISENQYDLNISLDKNSAGIYLLKLWIDNQEYQFKVIKLN